MTARTADNRALMPQVALWVDEVREVFGIDVTVTFAKEGFSVKGKQMPEGIVPVLPLVGAKK